LLETDGNMSSSAVLIGAAIFVSDDPIFDIVAIFKNPDETSNPL